ncbi:MAG: energy transducer TonB [Candidatus Schekmanbacteria bacterium]|nr:energy transducer TonB [Candidatus Schekmanbacteria bacterium]
MYTSDLSQRQLLYALALSSGIHLLLILLLPGLSPYKRAELPDYTEVKLMYLPPPPVMPVDQPILNPPVGKTKDSEKDLDYNPPKMAEPGARGDFFAERADQLSKSHFYYQEFPDVKPPAESGEQIIAGLLPAESAVKVDDLVLPASAPLTAGSAKAAQKGGFAGVDIQKPVKLTHLPEQIGIEWSGIPRGIKKQPPIPEYNSKIEGDISLKFWVNSAGKVYKVEPPTKKLDAELELLATKYMYQWEFDPLPGDLKPVNQWGTITIHFKHVAGR